MRTALVAVALGLVVAVATLVSNCADATLGVDLYKAYPTDTFVCLQKLGVNFIITRAWHSYGAFDDAAPINLNNAKLAGIANRDVYLFPCATKDPAQQVNDTLTKLGQSIYMFGTVWLDIELNVPGSGCGWSTTDLNQNCQFLGAMIAQAQKMSAPVGVYSSHFEWAQVMGPSCTVASSLPLWYAHYDNKTSFSDFVPFGGWTTPAIKQYTDQAVGNCGVVADMDWYPN